LSDTERRRFLFECPKNTIRSYDPPELNKVNLSGPARRFDIQLHDIQYRLSGLTRPIDWFAYQLVYSQWDLDTTRQRSLEFVKVIHELLSNLASHITKQRASNMFRGISASCDPPSDEPQNYLLDPKDMVDHIKLAQAVQASTRRRSSLDLIASSRPNHL
ncbi:hypothetical protein BCV72DRAFT_209553, partial [Rhizopus microsporus var. microsporus]